MSFNPSAEWLETNGLGGFASGTVQVQMPAELVNLEEFVHRRIHERTGGQVRQLRVFVSDGQVVITGQTRSYYLKQLVLAAALDVLRTQSAEIALNIEVD